MSLLAVATTPGVGATAGYAALARVERDGHPESWHCGAAAVVTPTGSLIGRLGDPAQATFLRSCAKPLQALDLVLAGGVERWALSTEDLALICASHSGTPEHARRAADLLARGGFDAAALQCGAHPPLDEAAARALREAGETPTALHNNCSGKHAGMLLCCRLHGWPTESYLELDHPLQQRVLEHVATLAAVPADQIAIAVDGCGVPTFSVALAGAARIFAALADPAAAVASLPHRSGNAELAAALDRVARAMTGAPAMVAGPGRFTTRLMEVTGGRILAKEGAEGLYAVAVRGPVALGAALKVADGSSRPRDGAVLEMLRQLGCLSGEELAILAAEGFHRPQRRNHAGRLVGEVVSDFDLEEVHGEAPPTGELP
jgi:L-asparaginase II